METSNLTNKILAYKEISVFDMNDAIDWAVDMLKLGYETPSLLILAGISKPTNFYESEDYLKNALKELNLNVLEREDAVFKYCTYYIEKMAKGENVKDNLSHIYNIANTIDDNKKIYDFYLLYWAWGDFDYGQEYSPYWGKSNPSNIQQVVIDEANKWLSS
jgi:hypothetical protein